MDVEVEAMAAGGELRVNEGAEVAEGIEVEDEVEAEGVEAILLAMLVIGFPLNSGNR